MFVVMNALSGLIWLVDTVLTLYLWVVIISALLSWVNPDPYNPIVRTLRNLTEPVFWRVRKLMPFTYVNGLDLSPMVVIIGIQLIKMVVIKSLAMLAMGVV